jgi:hypothetical protein
LEPLLGFHVFQAIARAILGVVFFAESVEGSGGEEQDEAQERAHDEQPKQESVSAFYLAGFGGCGLG